MTRLLSRRAVRLGAAAILVALIAFARETHPVAAASTWYVAPATAVPAGNDASVCDLAHPCLTIRGAIAKAGAGDTIRVAAGTFREQVVVDKNLTIIGAGSGSSTIRAPAVLAGDPDGTYTLVLISGAIQAEVSGFAVEGPSAGLNYGIYVRAGATANIHDNLVKDIRDEPLSGGQNGVAIQVGLYPYTPISQVGTATITANQVVGYQKIGIAVENAGSSATVTGNTVTGAGPTAVTAQNGIQLRRGATGTIKTNVVTGNAYDGAAYSAFGIGITYAGPGVVVQGNTVNHNGANIYCWESDGVQVLDNQVSDIASVDQNAVAGITVQGNNAATATMGLSGVTISGNTVQNNLSGPSTLSDGIDLYGIRSATLANNVVTGSSYDGVLIGGSGNIVLTGNRFVGNGLAVVDATAAAIDFRGIPARDWSQPSGYGGANPLGGFSAHGNTFTGNRNGISNFDAASVAASGNRWGSPTGPTDVANVGGTGQAISAAGAALFTPWCAIASCATQYGTPTVLSVLTQPGGATTNQPLSPQPVVRAQDAAGNLGVNFVGSVTVTIATNPASATLGGTTVRTAVAGVATFTDLSISSVGVGYTLRASSAGLAGVTTAAITIAPPQPSQPPPASDEPPTPDDSSAVAPILRGIVVVPFIGPPQTLQGLAVGGVAVSSVAPTVVVAQTTTLRPDGSETSPGTVTMSIPVGAVPGALWATLQPFASIDSLTALVPLPPDRGRILTAFAANALDATNRPIVSGFTESVSLTVTIPAAATPASSSLSDFALVMWSGSTWFDVPALVTALPDGSIQIGAEVTQFPICAVRYLPGGTPGQPVLGSVPVYGSLHLALSVLARGSVDDLEAGAETAGASGAWVQDGAGTYRLLVIGGAAFLKDAFVRSFPGGFPAPVAVMLVQS